MKKTLLHLFALALCFAGTSLYASTIYFTEDFESAVPQLAVFNAGQFTAIHGTNVDVVAASNGWGSLIVSPETGNAVDLGGTGGNSRGQLQTTNAIHLDPGTYQLSFDLNGSHRGVNTTTEVTLGSVLDQFISLASDQTSVQTFNFTLGSAEDLFLNFSLTEGADNIGSLLDNVTITGNAVPEPGSLLLLGTGLTALAGLVRRRFGVR